MSLMLLIFFFGVLGAGLALLLLTQDLMKMLIGFFTVVAGSSGIMSILMADLNAITQLLIYGGGITVLFVFGAMLSRHDRNQAQIANPVFNRVMGTSLVLILLMAMGFAIKDFAWESIPSQSVGLEGYANSELSTVTGIGKTLFGQYVIAFEWVGIVLLLVVAYVASLTVGNSK